MRVCCYKDIFILVWRILLEIRLAYPKKAHRSLVFAISLLILITTSSIAAPVSFASANIENDRNREDGQRYQSQRSAIGTSMEKRLDSIVNDVYTNVNPLKENSKEDNTPSAPNNVVEFMGTVDINSINQLNDSSTSSSLGADINNGTKKEFAVPYLTPLGEEEYNELKEKAESGELTQNTNIATLPKVESSLEELIQNEKTNANTLQGSGIVDP
jgi:hypothetical protein